ncbi:hypothetical protein, partial [uncultured Sphingomonas sp.]|uniref:hypothetical protein n=1 Tax=uncultured Sphingomonas sp. TaxID=158754 RepID=UPI0035CA1988
MAAPASAVKPGVGNGAALTGSGVGALRTGIACTTATEGPNTGPGGAWTAGIVIGAGVAAATVTGVEAIAPGVAGDSAAATSVARGRGAGAGAIAAGVPVWSDAELLYQA